MKTGLFIISVAAFVLALYFLVCDLLNSYCLSHFTYVMLLVIILLNSIAGIFMTWPDILVKKNK
ncbi:hypothetical protein Q765_01515 [Flavobacterium rivuli WB 3.3-2 = DSM 21788]|uniref:Uncharacterized protein n=1 Tax=Flavobacterium rivuli WB 3.3-2 = DSM 21788 TaxID=1121895 RepID=A0A0A2M8M5_9FLAO|nr:hypothetical protein Q765_01515 [Flavobacterium rivuli WB 3.3-2 = DSM 21788]